MVKTVTIIFWLSPEPQVITCDILKIEFLRSLSDDSQLDLNKNESSSRWPLMIFNLRNRPVRFLFLSHWIIFWTYVLSYNWNHSKSRKFWNFTLEINFLTLNHPGHIFKQFKISTFDLPYQWLIELKITIFERDSGKGV